MDVSLMVRRLVSVQGEPLQSLWTQGQDRCVAKVTDFKLKLDTNDCPEYLLLINFDLGLKPEGNNHLSMILTHIALLDTHKVVSVILSIVLCILPDDTDCSAGKGFTSGRPSPKQSVG